MADEFEVGVNIVADDTGITQAADAAGQAVDDMSKSLQGSTSEAAKSLDTLASDADGALTDVEGSATSAGSAIDELADGADKSFTALGDSADAGAKAVGDAASSAASAADSLSTDSGQALTDAQASFDAFAQAVSNVADDVNTSMSQAATDVSDTFGASGEIPQAVDNGAVSLTTKVGKFKAVGATLGSTLAQGVTSGIDGPQAALNVGSSVSGLLALSAKTIQGTVVGVGVGLGFSLISGVINAIQKNGEAAKAAFEKQVDSWTEAYIDGLGEIDKATRRMKLQAAIEDTESAWSKATDEVDDFAAHTGEALDVGVNTITTALFGTPEQQAAATNKINAAREAAQKAYEIGVNNKDLSQAQRDALGRQLNALNDITGIVGDENKALTTARDRYEEITHQAERLGLRTKEEKQARDEVNQAADRYNESVQRSIERMENLKGKTKEVYSWTNNAEAAAARYANALDRAAAAAARINANDNNRWNGVA